MLAVPTSDTAVPNKEHQTPLRTSIWTHTSTPYVVRHHAKMEEIALEPTHAIVLLLAAGLEPLAPSQPVPQLATMEVPA